MSHKITEIKSSEQFNTELEGETKYLFVDFYATWCGPCKKIEPKLKELSNEYDNVKFFKVDVDEVPVLAKQYKITCMPTFLLFEVLGGNIIPTFKRITGADPTKIINLLKSTRPVVINEDETF
jgi:thioredoxin 1